MIKIVVATGQDKIFSQVIVHSTVFVREGCRFKKKVDRVCRKFVLHCIIESEVTQKKIFELIDSRFSLLLTSSKLIYVNISRTCETRKKVFISFKSSTNKKKHILFSKSRHGPYAAHNLSFE